MTKFPAATPIIKMARVALPTIILALAISATVSPAFAKNKENCKAIGGKWLPGSTTNVERGACFFAIRTDTDQLNAQKRRFALAASEASLTTDECRNKGGKISRDNQQCVVEMGEASNSSQSRQ